LKDGLTLPTFEIHLHPQANLGEDEGNFLGFCAQVAVSENAFAFRGEAAPAETPALHSAL